MGFEIQKLLTNSVHSPEELNNFLEQSEPSTLAYSRKKYRVVALENETLDGVRDYLENLAEEAEEEDWDGDDLKQYAEDGAVSDLLKTLFYVYRTPNTYTVNVTFQVESDSELGAERVVMDCISTCGEVIDWNIDSVQED